MGRSFSKSFLTVTLPKVAAAMVMLASGLMAQANTILAEKWDNITGTAVTSLTSNAAYPNSPTSRSNPTLYELGTNVGDNYGTRTRGYVTPPTTGSYTFWIACDDNCELWLGTSNDPTTAVKIAGVSGTNWTNSREWTKFAEQQSAAKTLTAGVQYYIETRHKEGTGGDCLAVGWQGPGITGEAERPIPGTRLAPYVIPVAPAITTQPANQTVNVGQTATFSVVATGTPTPTYQWKKAGVAISGATAASYTTPATVAGDNGAVFTVTVTNSAGSVTSGNATLTVNTPPTITTQPANQTVNVGQTATFSVTATGAGTLTYQWKKAGTAISGATAATYTTPATVAGDNGAIFTVVVTNTAGSTTSSNATLSVNTIPVITTQPASQTVNVGQTATFSVAATGSATFTYQWTKGGVAISGATSSSYTTPATVAGDNNSVFAVVVTNTVGSTTSSNATLTVNVGPAITTQPANQTVNVGQTATFTVVATGTPAPTYQWKKGGVVISGATAASYTTPATVAGDNGSVYTVVVTNSVSSVTSSGATLTVNTPPSITTQPANQTVLVGQTATFSVVAAGSGTLTYQWTKGGVSISGATAASYTTPATVAGDNGAVFAVVVTNSLGSVTSTSATLTCNIPPSITTQPSSQTVTVGQTATFSVVATGTATLTYQWTKGGVNISGATASSYTTPATVSGDNGAVFAVVVTNSFGSVTSTGATLTVNTASTPPSITTQPSNTTVTVPATATFTVVASGTAPLTYQWKKGGVAISGANAASYTTPATAAADDGSSYTVLVTNSLGSVLSNAATLTCITPPAITTQPISQTVNPGQTATFSVVATGTLPLSYQWKKGGVNISGATATSYVTPATTSADNGTLYSVTVTNAGGSVTSANATLNVNIPVTLPVVPIGQSVLVGQTATFTVTASGTPPFAYQWLKGGTTIAGATSSSYTTPLVVIADNGTLFSVVVTNVVGSVTSSTATLTVNQVPSITTQPVSQTVAVGQTATFTVAATGTAPLGYQWKKNGTAITGGNSSSYTTPAAVAGDDGTIYSVHVTNSYGTAISANATLTVGTPITITAQPQDMVVAETQTATFSVTGQSSQSMTYQWKKNGTSIANATLSTYTTPMTAQSDNNALFTCVISGPGGASSTTSNPARLQVVGTKFNPGSTTGAPVLDVSTTFGSGSTGSRSGMKIASTNGTNSGGDAVSLAVSASAGESNTGTVTAESLSVVEVAGNSADLTGLNVKIKKDANSTVSTAYGLKVNLDAPVGKAYSATFMGGKVGVGTMTPSEALEVTGNLKIGAAMIGRTIDFGDAASEPSWQLLIDEPYGDLVLKRANGTVVFRDLSTYEGQTQFFEFNRNFRLYGDDVVDNGTSTHALTTFDYMNGIFQDKAVSGPDGQASGFFSSSLDSKTLFLDEESPPDGTSKILSATAMLNHATLTCEKLTGDGTSTPLDHLLTASPYSVRFELWQEGGLLQASNIDDNGFSTTQGMKFYGDDSQEDGNSTFKQTLIDRENGLQNAWITTFADGTSRTSYSSLNKLSLQMGDLQEYPASIGYPANSAEYSNQLSLANDGFHLENNSMKMGDADFSNKLISDVRNGVAQMDYLDVEGNVKQMKVGIYGLEYSSVTFDHPGATTDIDENGVATTGEITANSITVAGEVTANSVHATSVVTTPSWRIPDYVFEKEYPLQSLDSLAKFVDKNKHLPNIPGAQEIKDKGMDLTEMNVKLLEKVEELTLHMIEMDKELKSQKKKNSSLEKTVRKLQSKVKED